MPFGRTRGRDHLVPPQQNTYEYLEFSKVTDKSSLPFISPTAVGTESTQDGLINPSLLRPANDTQVKVAIRPTILSLFKLTDEKKIKLLDAESPDLPSMDLEKDETSPTEPIPLSAYFLLASAVVALSCIAPLLDLQEADAIMKIVWRQSATTMLLAVWAAASFNAEGSCGIDGPPSAKSWVCTILAGVFYSPLCTMFSMSLDYTTVENAVAFSNTQSLLILLGKYLLGAAVSQRQSVGALVAFGGFICFNLDSIQMMVEEVNAAAADGDSNPSAIFYGDVMSCGSAIFGVGYLLLSKEARTEISLFPFMFVLMLSAAIVSNITAYSLGKPLQVLSMDEYWGTFGFLHWDRIDRLPLEIITVIVCNIFGTMGYIRALKYFDPLVVSVAALSEPVVAQFISFVAQVGLLPGWFGWIGNALIAIGSYCVAYQPLETKEEPRKDGLFRPATIEDH
ncbi:MAG: hypothetical protein SGBAC_003677 [Bacillariaceae sp.]